MGGAHIARVHQAGIAQYPEVMGHAGLGTPPVEFATGGLWHVGQVAHDVQAHGVAQGVQHTLKRQFLRGNVFYIMKPTPPADRPDATSLSFSYEMPRPGHCAWNELASADPAAALHFYGQRFGWVKDGEMDMGPLGTYEFLRHAGRAPDGSSPGHGMLGAVMPKMPEMPVSAWTYYFRVSDIDVAIAAITANGGTIVQPPIEIPGGDFSMVGVDPQGAVFALVGSRT